MSELTESPCQGPECPRTATRRSPDKKLLLCATHSYQLKRHGEMTPLRQCAMDCGQMTDSRSDVCRRCRADLKDRGEGWCPNHGVLPTDQLGANGRCNVCNRVSNEAWRAVNRVVPKCAMGCGRNRQRGGSEICNPCFLELAENGMARCNRHGVMPGSNFRNGMCIECHAVTSDRSKRRPRRLMLAEQNDRCAICEKNLTTKNMCIDHDHSHDCGKNSGCAECRRMILCYGCNTMLGRYHDDPAMMTIAIGKSKTYDEEWLRAGIKYLEYWNAEMVRRGVRKYDVMSASIQWLFEQTAEVLAQMQSI